LSEQSIAGELNPTTAVCALKTRSYISSFSSFFLDYLDFHKWMMKWVIKRIKIKVGKLIACDKQLDVTVAEMKKHI